MAVGFEIELRYLGIKESQESDKTLLTFYNEKDGEEIADLSLDLSDGNGRYPEIVSKKIMNKGQLNTYLELVKGIYDITFSGKTTVQKWLTGISKQYRIEYKDDSYGDFEISSLNNKKTVNVQTNIDSNIDKIFNIEYNEYNKELFRNHYLSIYENKGLKPVMEKLQPRSKALLFLFIYQMKILMNSTHESLDVERKPIERITNENIENKLEYLQNDQNAKLIFNHYSFIKTPQANILYNSFKPHQDNLKTLLEILELSDTKSKIVNSLNPLKEKRIKRYLDYFTKNIKTYIKEEGNEHSCYYYYEPHIAGMIDTESDNIVIEIRYSDSNINRMISDYIIGINNNEKIIDYLSKNLYTL